MHAFSDHSKVRRVFGPPASRQLADGIERMAAWVRAHGPWTPVEFPGEIEVDVNLPPSWRERVALS